MARNQFHLEGFFRESKYVLDARSIFPGIDISDDYTMRYAAKEVFRYGEVPDGSGFKHYFDNVSVVDEVGAVWANVGPGGLYRWL